MCFNTMQDKQLSMGWPIKNAFTEYGYEECNAISEQNPNK